MKKSAIKPGNHIKISTINNNFSGLIMPSSNKEKIVLKLDSGYNVGILRKNVKDQNLVKKIKTKKEKIAKVKRNKNLPDLLILHTGGTVASKIDYKTGAVSTKFTPEDIVAMYPELNNIANIKSELVFQMFSGDIEPEHWQLLAKKVAKELKKNISGIIITHGTDTMHYTAAAIAFMIQNPDKPIILVGAQRSSDRGSSDAAINMLAAANFITKSKFKGVAICMHANLEDKSCYVHSAVKTRKMHTSRRDAFHSINEMPIAKVHDNGNVEFLQEQKQKEGKLEIKTGFDKRIAIIKIRPGFTAKELLFYKNYKGLIIEGTGLGHMPVTSLDRYTKHHKSILNALKKLSKKIIVVMTSQCLYGRTNLNVYAYGRTIKETGIINAEDMLPEVAYVKLGWLLGNIKNKEKVRKEMLNNYVNEINPRIDEKSFLF